MRQVRTAVQAMPVRQDYADLTESRLCMPEANVYKGDCQMMFLRDEKPSGLVEQTTSSRQLKTIPLIWTPDEPQLEDSCHQGLQVLHIYSSSLCQPLRSQDRLHFHPQPHLNPYLHRPPSRTKTNSVCHHLFPTKLQLTTRLFLKRSDQKYRSEATTWRTQSAQLAI